jgi:hypothetical protein
MVPQQVQDTQERAQNTTDPWSQAPERSQKERYEGIFTMLSDKLLAHYARGAAKMKRKVMPKGMARLEKMDTNSGTHKD